MLGSVEIKKMLESSVPEYKWEVVVPEDLDALLLICIDPNNKPWSESFMVHWHKFLEEDREFALRFFQVMARQLSDNLRLFIGDVRETQRPHQPADVVPEERREP